MSFISLVQKINLEEKLKNAPDDQYQIGILIGSLVPFVLLVAVAYWMYYRAKNRNENE